MAKGFKEYNEIVLYASNPIENATELVEALKKVEDLARIALNTGRIIRVGAVEVKPLTEKDKIALGLS